MLNDLYSKIDKLNEEVEGKAQDVVQNADIVKNIYENYGMSEEELNKIIANNIGSLLVKRVSGKRIKFSENDGYGVGFKIEDEYIKDGCLVKVFPGNDITWSYSYGIYQMFDSVTFKPGAILIKGGQDIAQPGQPSEFEQQTLEFVYIIIPGFGFSGVKGIFHRKLYMGGDI